MSIYINFYKRKTPKVFFHIDNNAVKSTLSFKTKSHSVRIITIIISSSLSDTKYCGVAALHFCRHCLLTGAASLAALITDLIQLVQGNSQVFLVVHPLGNGSQVVFNSGGTQAVVELIDVVEVEGERLVVDVHLGDISHGALVH